MLKVTSSWRVVPSWFIYKCDERYTLCLNVMSPVTPVMEIKPYSSTWCSEAATRNVLWKNMFLEISQNSQENTSARVSFLIKLQAEACNFIKKETLAQLFSCDFCEVSKNAFFKEHLWATASAETLLYLVIINSILFLSYEHLIILAKLLWSLMYSQK